LRDIAVSKSLRIKSSPAIEMFDEDDEQHEAAEAFLREAMVRVARREIAIGIYRNKHGNQEAA